MSGKKRLLFVSARLPYPTIEGHQIRTYGVLKELSKHYEIHLLSLLREGEGVEEDNPLDKLCTSIVGVKISTKLPDLLSAGLNSIFNQLPLVVCKYVTSDLIQAFKKYTRS